MAHTLNKLKALSVERERNPGRHSDGGGLYLNAAKSGSKSWVYMWSRKLGPPRTKRYEMGLGSYPAVSLEKARRRAQQCRGNGGRGTEPD